MEAGREPRVRDEVAVYCVRTDPPNSRRNGVVGPWIRFTQKSATSVDDSRIEGDLMSPGKGTVLSPALHTTTPWAPVGARALIFADRNYLFTASCNSTHLPTTWASERSLPGRQFIGVRDCSWPSRDRRPATAAHCALSGQLRRLLAAAFSPSLSASHSLINDCRVTPIRRASRSRESTIQPGKSTFTRFGSVPMRRALVRSMERAARSSARARSVRNGGCRS